LLEPRDEALLDDALDKDGVKGSSRGLPLLVSFRKALAVATLDFDDTDGMSGTSLGRIGIDS